MKKLFLALLLISPPAFSQSGLMMMGVERSASKVISADVYIDTSFGTNGSTLTAANLTSGKHQDITCTTSVTSATSANINANNAGFLQTFATAGFKVQVPTQATYDGTPANAGFGISINEATIGTSGTQKAICTITAVTRVREGFFFKTGQTGSASNLYNYGWISSNTSGYQISAQWSDKGSWSGQTGCTSSQLAFDLEVFDSVNTHHGNCFVLANNTIYWVELYVDRGSQTASMYVYNGACQLQGSSTTTMNIGTDTGFNTIVIGTNPDGGNAAGTLFLSNWIISTDPNGTIPGFGC